MDKRSSLFRFKGQGRREKRFITLASSVNQALSFPIGVHVGIDLVDYSTNFSVSINLKCKTRVRSKI
jgi:hypothetical protein